MNPTRHQIQTAVKRLYGQDTGLTKKAASAIVRLVSDKELMDAGYHQFQEIRKLADEWRGREE